VGINSSLVTSSLSSGWDVRVLSPYERLPMTDRWRFWKPDTGNMAVRFALRFPRAGAYTWEPNGPTVANSSQRLVFLLKVADDRQAKVLKVWNPRVSGLHSLSHSFSTFEG
jgi:hypothetical protein